MPRYHKCVLGCTEYRHLYIFPTVCARRMELWAGLVGVDVKSIKKSTRICDRHFKDEHKGKKKLLLDAVPVKFLPNTRNTNDGKTSKEVNATFSKDIILKNTSTSTHNKQICDTVATSEFATTFKETSSESLTTLSTIPPKWTYSRFSQKRPPQCNNINNNVGVKFSKSEKVSEKNCIYTNSKSDLDSVKEENESFLVKNLYNIITKLTKELHETKASEKEIVDSHMDIIIDLRNKLKEKDKLLAECIEQLDQKEQQIQQMLEILNKQENISLNELIC